MLCFAARTSSIGRYPDFRRKRPGLLQLYDYIQRLVEAHPQRQSTHYRVRQCFELQTWAEAARLASGGSDNLLRKAVASIETRRPMDDGDVDRRGLHGLLFDGRRVEEQAKRSDRGRLKTNSRGDYIIAQGPQPLLPGGAVHGFERSSSQANRWWSPLSSLPSCR